jgi:hypothetical protein
MATESLGPTGMFQQFLQEATGPSSTDTVCLVTGEPLGENAITLPCSHQFNYAALFAELVVLRRTGSRPYDTNYVSRREMRCPYCRARSSGILPYVPTVVSERTPGVNAPQRFCMQHRTCEQRLTRGARKNATCGRPGFEYSGHNVCPVHWGPMARAAAIDSAWSDVHQAAMATHTCVALRALLRANGLSCGGRKRVMIARLVHSQVNLDTPVQG